VREALRLVVPALVFAAAAAPARADDDVPVYELPAGFEAPRLTDAKDAAARHAVATILDPRSPDDEEDAVRILAGLGRGALPHVVQGMTNAGWCARAALVAAAAEMDAPDATPLLAAACRDPAFAVREAAALGLGKTGDARGAEALARCAASGTEPAWRVRAAAATAVRRAVLRGAMDRAAGEAALLALLADPDEDARRAAVKEIAPLAASAALPALLDLYGDPKTPQSDRTLVLAALRAYRTPDPALVEALRRGFLAGTDPWEAAEAGRALLAMRGVAALADAEVSEGIVHHLHESEYAALREALARLGRPAAPWLRDRTMELAARIAAGRDVAGETTFGEFLDTLIQVDEEAGLAAVKEFLSVTPSVPYDRETRLAALRKADLVYAQRLAMELRALCDAKAGDDLRPELLRAIVASGGDDLAARLDAALANDRRAVRSAALVQLDRCTELGAGENLRALARGSKDAADPAERFAAIETLSRRDDEGDRAEAAAIAARLLDDPQAAMRDKAISVLSASRDPADFDRLLARIGKEDGADVKPAKPRDGHADPPREGTTPSDHVSDAGAVRGRLVRGLLGALATSGGERARPVLLQLAESDADAGVRKFAAAKLRGIAVTADAPKLLALEAKDPDPDVRRELLRTLAGLGGSPEAAARFAELVANPRDRSDTLALLAERHSSVVPAGLAEGLAGTDWPDDDRRAALVILDRAGRAPGVPALAALVSAARTLDLCDEAARVLAARKEPDAGAALVALLGRVEDPAKLAIVVLHVGARGLPEAEAPLLELFEKTRDRAFAAPSAGEVLNWADGSREGDGARARFVQPTADASVALYRICADAIAQFGSRRTGEALVRHLLDPRLAHAVARNCVNADGHLGPDAAAPVAILQSLVAAFARRDDEACRDLVRAHVAALAEVGRDFALPEAFAAGVARYLHTPLAFGPPDRALPARPRPAAAAVLYDLVLREAPRMSDADLRACQAADEHCAQEGRYAEAAAALRTYSALADVEDAARSTEQRNVEACRIAARTAQALAAEGRAEEALALARKLRDADASSGELAYRQGWCLLRIGHAGPEPKAALLFALAQDDKDARIHFQLAWAAEQTDGPEAALASYDQAVTLDRRRVQERQTEDSGSGWARAFEASAYPYWFARALKRAGRADAARAWLVAAVALDDRLAAFARADTAFAGWGELEAALAEGLAKIRRGALR
jgi:HEAT repeat protein